MENRNIKREEFLLGKKTRRKMNNHHSFILWFTGLSGSGKSTLAKNIEKNLYKMGHRTYSLDGDNIRHGLNKDLGFTIEDRAENIRRIGEVAKLFVDAGTIVTSSFISPYTSERRIVRNMVEDGEFIEVFVKCPIEVCESRDVKGLYKKARAGEIKGFTGIDDPYEEPEDPEIIIDTSESSIEESVDKIIEFLKEKNYIKNE